MRTYQITAAIIVLAVVLFSSGCIQRDAIVKDTFLLNAQRPCSSVQEPIAPVLMVSPFSIAPAYADKDLVRQVGPHQYESSYYNEYFISPAAMITDQTRNWLTESGLFETVLPPASTANPEIILEGHVRHLRINQQDPSNSTAELGITFILLKHDKRDRVIRYQKTYTATVPAEAKATKGHITAQNAALTQILESLEKDLIKLF